MQDILDAADQILDVVADGREVWAKDRLRQLAVERLLVQELRAVARDDVSAFVAAAVRHELGRQHLHAFVDELVAELGPSDEAEVVRYSELFVSAAVAETGRKASK